MLKVLNENEKLTIFQDKLDHLRYRKKWKCDRGQNWEIVEIETILNPTWEGGGLI